MIRTFRIGLSNILSTSLRTGRRNPCVTQAAQYSSGGDYSIVIDKDTGLERFENDEEFDARYEAFFNNPKIDGWEIRKGMTDMHGMDLVPEPKIIIAALKACRRVNDYALAVRYLEAVQNKSIANKDIWPYILQQINPTLEELGIFTPAQMGYDRPELALKQVYDMHGKDSE